MVASPAVSHRLPHGDDNPFTNPDMFDPDRYAEGRREDQLVPRTFIGFGSGKHACMGENFAYLQVKTIVSTLLRNFKLTPLSSSLPKPDYTVRGREEVSCVASTLCLFPQRLCLGWVAALLVQAMVVPPQASHTRVRYERVK